MELDPYVFVKQAWRKRKRKSKEKKFLPAYFLFPLFSFFFSRVCQLVGANQTTQSSPSKPISGNSRTRTVSWPGSWRIKNSIYKRSSNKPSTICRRVAEETPSTTAAVVGTEAEADIIVATIGGMIPCLIRAMCLRSSRRAIQRSNIAREAGEEGGGMSMGVLRLKNVVIQVADSRDPATTNSSSRGGI